jgi:phenylalanyl-tRNA synthetase beta chain
MPKIEVRENMFFKYLGIKLNKQKLISTLECAKAELDSWSETEGILKIELNDTNRPDLWSTTGLTRQLRYYLDADLKEYGFFSSPTHNKNAGPRIVNVDAKLKNIRPYIAAFIVQGPPLDESHLIDIIQSQEKLCDNFGRKRKSIAMGVYRADIINFPINYIAAEPDKTHFVPLGMKNNLSLREILKQHPKGQEYGVAVKDFERYPFLVDNRGGVLSFPPIINSDKIGAVEVGDNNLFIELTGTHLDTLLLATSITACDFADMGYEVQPVKIEYPYATAYGESIITPFYFQKQIKMRIADAEKLLGEKIDKKQAALLIKKMGNQVKIKDDAIVVIPPAYRNDFMHPVDAIEEIMMGRGMESFKPIMPEDFTVGRLTKEEEFGRRVKDILVGLGFQEMIYNYLGSKKDIIEKMNISDQDIIEIANPMTESYEIIRNSIIPCLLNSEAVSANAVYPHRIFEVGKVVSKHAEDNYGCRTINTLGLFAADREAGFNYINSQISAIFYYLSKDYKLKEEQDPRFIQGRTGVIIYKNKRVGIIGEIHPAVLANWGIQMPCVAAEVDLDMVME